MIAIREKAGNTEAMTLTSNSRPPEWLGNMVRLSWFLYLISVGITPWLVHY
jgi:hypothetical protein